MLDINFEIQEIDFYEVNQLAIENNVDRFEILSSALIQGVLVAEEQKLLSSFFTIEKLIENFEKNYSLQIDTTL